MILRFTGKIVTWLIKQDAIPSDDRELYEYAMYSLILTIRPLLLVMVIGGLMGKFVESICIILPFLFIRKFSGGFHAKHAWTCFLGSCALLSICIYLTSYLIWGLGLRLVTIGGVVSLWIWSPIDSENRRLSLEEKEQYKTAARIVSIVFFGMIVLLTIIRAERYAVCFAMGLILSAGLQVPCIVERFWRSFKGNCHLDKSDQKL